MQSNFEFIWSDGWYIDADKAWFVDGEHNALYRIDMTTGQCQYVAAIPNENKNRFRLNPRVMKVSDEIFCMPDIGGSVWVYNVKHSGFDQIVIDNRENIRLACADFWEYEKKLFVISRGLKQIIEINVIEKRIDSYYPITNISEEKVGCSVKVGKEIYVVSMTSNRVYQFDIKTKQVSIYNLPDVDGGLYTIGFDGQRFWMSGYKKEIYVWNKEDNSVKILRDFPKNFGEYDFSGQKEVVLDCEKEVCDRPTFFESLIIGGHIWFVPFQTNEILYIDIRTGQISVLELPGEEETRDSLMAHYMAHKYLFQYIVDDQYLGLYSFKNKGIIEINTKDLKSEVRNFVIHLRNYIDDLQDYMFVEGNIVDRRAFACLLRKTANRERIMKDMGTGERIYRQTML